jgi:hypothetical protein
MYVVKLGDGVWTSRNATDWHCTLSVLSQMLDCESLQKRKVSFSTKYGTSSWNWRRNEADTSQTDNEGLAPSVSMDQTLSWWTFRVSETVFIMAFIYFLYCFSLRSSERSQFLWSGFLNYTGMAMKWNHFCVFTFFSPSPFPPFPSCCLFTYSYSLLVLLCSSFSLFLWCRYPHSCALIVWKIYCCRQKESGVLTQGVTGKCVVCMCHCGLLSDSKTHYLQSFI